MTEKEERLDFALRIAIEALKCHVYCGERYPDEGWPSVHQAFIDINLAREGKHPYQSAKSKTGES